MNFYALISVVAVCLAAFTGCSSSSSSNVSQQNVIKKGAEIKSGKEEIIHRHEGKTYPNTPVKSIVYRDSYGNKTQEIVYLKSGKVRKKKYFLMRGLGGNDVSTWTSHMYSSDGSIIPNSYEQDANIEYLKEVAKIHKRSEEFKKKLASQRPMSTFAHIEKALGSERLKKDAKELSNIAGGGVGNIELRNSERNNFSRPKFVDEGRVRKLASDGAGFVHSHTVSWGPNKP